MTTPGKPEQPKDMIQVDNIDGAEDLSYSRTFGKDKGDRVTNTYDMEGMDEEIGDFIDMSGVSRDIMNASGSAQ